MNEVSVLLVEIHKEELARLERIAKALETIAKCMLLE